MDDQKPKDQDITEHNIAEHKVVVTYHLYYTGGDNPAEAMVGQVSQENFMKVLGAKNESTDTGST